MRLSFVSLVTILALSCSGGQPPPETAFITTDQAAIGFDQLFGSGTYIGTKPQASLDIHNAGQGDLHISAYQLSGDAAFSFKASTDAPVTVKGEQDTFLVVYFAPTQPIEYTGQIVIQSDAPNVDGGLVIKLSGLGIRPPSNCNLSDGGLRTPDEADGGCSNPDGGH